MSVAIHEAVPHEAAFTPVHWLPVEACPACDSQATACVQSLRDTEYRFGSERIRLPEGGIALAACAECGLIYKTRVPAPQCLAGIFARQAGAKWLEPYDFAVDVAELRAWLQRQEFDLLDVGACGGGLLAACGPPTSGCRRSALDVIAHPGLSRHLAGEFIQGFLDSQLLSWSTRPYEIVTLFDVAEHLYRPRLAFANLRALVREQGLVVVETGNVDSTWPREFGAAEWWYTRLIEHHVFWSRRSLERIAREFGFELALWQERRHKSRARMPLGSATSEILKVGLYRVSPQAYARLAGVLGKYSTQPWSPFARDHFRALLRRIR